jgi:hypothetical protein
MVIKLTSVLRGWSYGNGDDQYDYESIGSTETVVKLKKSMENSSRNKKNEHDDKMCSRRQEEQHTNDQGWTTIDMNSKRKPKSKTSNKTTIDSIISTIDVEFNIDTNGTLEATIDSPVRKNVCTVPDKIVYNDKKDTYETTDKEHRTTATKVTHIGKEERKEITSKKTTTETKKNKSYKRKKEQEKLQDIQRRIGTAISNKKKDKELKENHDEKTRTISKGDENDEQGITTKAVKGQKENQRNYKKKQETPSQYKKQRKEETTRRQTRRKMKQERQQVKQTRTRYTKYHEQQIWQSVGKQMVDKTSMAVVIMQQMMTIIEPIEMKQKA